MWIIWVLKVLCVLNICGFLYRLSSLYNSILYFKQFLLKNGMSISLIVITFIIIYSFYHLMYYMIKTQEKISKELHDIKSMIKEMYDACEIK